MATATITYDGDRTLTATITNAEIGRTYTLLENAWPYSAANFDYTDGTAVSSTLVITHVGTYHWSTYSFDCYVKDTGDHYIGKFLKAEIFIPGSTNPITPFNGTWSYDGVKTVSFTTSDAVAGRKYLLQNITYTYGGSNSITVATGSLQTFTNVIPTTPTPSLDYLFHAGFYDYTDYELDSTVALPAKSVQLFPLPLLVSFN